MKKKSNVGGKILCDIPVYGKTIGSIPKKNNSRVRFVISANDALVA